jgi:hypothetical protein
VTGGCKEIYQGDSSGLILDQARELSDELGSRVCPGELFQASTGVFPAPRTTGSMRQFNGQVCIPVFPCTSKRYLCIFDSGSDQSDT